MRVIYHPDFPSEIKKFTAQYRQVSERLGSRFRKEVEDAIKRITTSPSAAGHFLNTGSEIVGEVRRRNLPSFPFFILYGISGDMLVFRSVIPSASDPLIWLARLSTEGGQPPTGANE